MLTASIDPDLCIGCGICLEKCPFDAIIGAPGYLHTVLVAECIGCKLCVNPCPVDCITLAPLPQELCGKKIAMVAHAKHRRMARIQRQEAAQAISFLNKARIVKDLEDLKDLIVKAP